MSKASQLTEDILDYVIPGHKARRHKKIDDWVKQQDNREREDQRRDKEYRDSVKAHNRAEELKFLAKKHKEFSDMERGRYHTIPSRKQQPYPFRQDTFR